MPTSNDGCWRRVAAAGTVVLAALIASDAPAIAIPPPSTSATPAVPADEVVLRRIALPVQGSFSYSDDFGAPRPGERTHQGNDLMTSKLRPLLAAADATVTQVKVDNGGISGNMLVLKDDDGWAYYYIHINNDTPGTDDGANPLEFAFAPGVQVGAKVKAGEIVAYAGDSGNAESTGPHLHFEIHQPDGTAVDPYPSLRIAQGFRYGSFCAFDANPKRKPNAASAPGYWALGADGGIFSFGAAPFLGSTGDRKLNRPTVALAATPGGAGYWFAGTDGGIFAFGDAGFFGSTGAITLAQPIVGMASTSGGKGYWLVARDGGIFAFGDAGFFGSAGSTKLAQPIVGMAATPTGKGYWLAAADGGIFAYGDAAFVGSTGDIRLNQPITGMAPTPTGKGYWLVARDGGIFTFGDASYLGSLPGTGLCELPTAVRILPSATGRGYWVAGADGSVRAFGDAVDLGSPRKLGLTTASGILDLVAVRPRPAPTLPLLRLLTP